MQIAQNTVVALNYTLTSPGDDGEQVLIEETTLEAPMLFIFGMEQMPERFEAEMAGKATGDSFDFVLPAEETGYGDYNEDMLMELPKDTFVVDGTFDAEAIQEGNIVPMHDESGNELMAQIIEVKDDVVVIDFNHPLAGIDLHFKGTVGEVRAATEEEIAHGHVHGAEGHNHE